MARILSSLPGDLSPRLARLESHVRHLKLLRGIGSFGVVVVTAFAVGFLLDICFEFSVNFRLGLLAAVLGTFAVGFVVCVIRPLSGSYTAEELAAVVETAHPELRERLTSTIELNDPGVPERDKGSRLMRLLLAKETARSTASMNFNRSVSQRRMLRASVLGFAAVIVLLAPFVLSPDGYGLLWARFFAPWKNYDAATNLYFDVDYGNGVVAKGSDVTITAEPNFRVGDGKLPKEVFLNLTDDENNADRIRMDYDEETQTYSTTVSHVFHSFQFDVSADRTRTKRYDIRVVEAPAITAVQLDVRPPPYTGRKAEHVDGVVGTIDVFENSICTLTVRFNKAVESAKLEWLTVERPVTDTDPKTEDAKPADATPLPDPPSKLVLAADHKSATLTMIANAGGQFAVKLTDEYGLNNDDPANRRLTIVPDRPPELTVDANATQLVRPRDVVPVIVGATDDVGVGAVELHIERPDGHKSRIPVPPKKLGGLQVAHTFRVDVSRFQLQEGESLKYRVRAADDRMVPDGKGNWLAKPHIIWSDLRSLTIDKKAKAAGTDKVAAKQKALKDTLTAIRKDLVKNRDTVDGVRKEADEDNRKQLKFQGDETIGKLADEQSRLSQRIEDLAGQFGQHPLFGNLTKKLQEVARQDVAPAGRQLAKAKDQPLNNKPGELQKNVAKIDAAVKKLRALEEEFDKLAEIERDLMELSRLAQQAKRLADQAQQLDDMLKDPPEGETPQQKQAREDAIAIRQQQLKNRHQDLTDQLDDLLKRRPELLDAARKQQLDKLAELSRKALELAEPQDKLGDALKKESQQAAQQAADLAKQQQQLAQQAEKLAADAEAAGKKAAVTPLDPEALRKAVDALKKGDLKAALDRQQAAAKELERLAGELQKNQTLPADPQKAAEELAKRQQQLNKDVDALAKKPSQADADPQQQDQFQQELRKLAARQAGIQVGVAQLNAPRKNHAEQQDAVNKAADSVQKLLAAKPQDAAKAGKQTHDALQKLAKNIGSKQQRKAAALKTVEQLRQQQDRLAGQVANQTQKEKQGQSTKTTADELQKLNKQQEQIARKVADLDAPDAEQTQQHALRKQAAAMLDLQNRRTQDADASQQQARQALARLQKQLAGQPLPEEQVRQLAKQQQVVKQQADVSLKKAGKGRLTADQKQRLQTQADRQKQIAGKLAKLDVPAAKPEQQSAQKAAQQAAEQLKKADDPQQVASALKKADAAMQQLQKAVDPNRKQSPAQQAQRLAKQQKAAAQTAKQTAAAERPPKADQLQKQGEQLEQLTKQAERLPAGDAAQQEKKQALEQLRKAAEKKQQLAQQAEKEQPKNSDKPGEQLQRLMKDDAQAQKKAADTLQQLAKKLNNKQPQQQLAEQQQQQLDKLDKPNQPQLDQLARQAEKLADEQAKLRKQTEQANAQKNETQRNRKLQNLAQQQQQLQKKAGQLPAQQAPLQRADALQKLQQAAKSLKKPDGQQAARQQKNAEQSLRKLARQARNLAAAQKQAGKNAQQQAQQAAQQAQKLAQQQQDLAKQLQQLQQKQQAGQKQASAQPQNGKKQSGQNQNGQTQNSKQTPNPVTEQQKIAKQAAKLAVDAAEEKGLQSEAAKKAAQFARRADAAAKQAAAGQLPKAADSAQQAADSAQQAAKQLGSKRQPAGKPLQKRSAQLAQRQAQNAKALQQARKSTPQRRAAQQAGQRQLTKQTQQLAKQFQQAAKQLSEQPLNRPQQGRQAQKAGQATQRAQQSGKQAAKQLQQGNPSQASQNAKQAAQQLRQAAGQSKQAGRQSPQSPIPGKVGQQVTDAAKALQQAGKQLAQAKQPSGQQQASNSQQGMGKQGMGKQGMGKQGMGKQGMGKQGMGKGMGKGQGKGQGQSASRQLRQAADALAQAARQMGLQPGRQGQGQGQKPGGKPGKNGSGNGARAGLDLKQMESQLKTLSFEQWGKLPGHLRTEILQQAQKKPNSDYAKLIKLYFRDIAAKERKARRKAPRP